AYRQTAREDFRLTGEAKAEYSLGDAKASQKVLDDFIAKYGNESRYLIAEVYAWRGEPDKAFEWLERSVAAREVSMTWLKIDRNFRSLREDPRYKDVLRKMNLPERIVASRA